jgi:hypothetical protein
MYVLLTAPHGTWIPSYSTAAAGLNGFFKKYATPSAVLDVDPEDMYAV